jgi:uncharacterized protein
MLRLAMAATALMISTTAFSAVTVKTPEQIKVVAFNDQEVKTGLFSNVPQTFKIDAGLNQISVRYTEYFEHSDLSHDIVRSGIITLQTPSLVDGQTYHLALINAPKNFEQAQTYKQQPIIGFYNAQNQLLVEQSTAVAAKKPLFTGLNSTSDSIVDLTTTSNEQPAAISTSAVKKPLEAKVVTENGSSKPVLKNLELIDVWKNSTPEQRQQFMSWLAIQSK